MMNSSPIGIIISKKQKILYYNIYAQDILTKINLTVSESSLSKLAQYESVSQNNDIKTIKIHSSYIYYDLKQIVFENEEATLTILNDISKVFEFQAQQNQHQMLEMLVATSTHELRTPLHCIKNTLQLINDEGLTQEMDSLSRAMSACEMQECYINDILDFAKLKSDTLVLVKEPTNVTDVLAEVYSYFESLARESQIILKLECQCDNMHINADSIRLKQVLFNLMSNALKFTQEGKIILSAYSYNQKVHIEVQDTGIGMTTDEINKLFKPFNVAESSRKYNKSGTGLGLFLSMKLCQLMDGEIVVCSKKNIGSTFTLVFALLPQNVAYPSNKKKLSKRSSMCLSSKFMDRVTSNKVLIVDDNGFNCSILEKMLSTLNVGSYKALNGKTALELIKCKADIKLAFVDLSMPVMDGYELCGCVKQYYNDIGKPAIPMYALSGDGTNDARMKCMKIGFRGLLTKPFTKQMLMEVLSQY
jgi:signal transduction histidine kinase